MITKCHAKPSGPSCTGNLLIARSCITSSKVITGWALIASTKAVHAILAGTSALVPKKVRPRSKVPMQSECSDRCPVVLFCSHYVLTSRVITPRGYACTCNSCCTAVLRAGAYCLTTATPAMLSNMFLPRLGRSRPEAKLNRLTCPANNLSHTVSTERVCEIMTEGAV